MTNENPDTSGEAPGGVYELYPTNGEIPVKVKYGTCYSNPTSRRRRRGGCADMNNSVDFVRKAGREVSTLP